MKNFKSLAAFTAASMISLASVATPIFAADATVSFPTNVSTPDGHITADESHIEYVVTPKTTGYTDFSDDAPAETVFNGVDKVSFTVTESIKADNAATDKVIEYTNVTISCDDASNFPGAGYFMYQLQADTDVDAEGNKGITAGTETYDVKVYVTYDNEGHLQVESYTFYRPGTDEKLTANDLEFGHVYNPSVLHVAKKIAGNQANPNQPFKFDLTINSNVTGKTYTVFPNATEKKNEDGSITYSFNLKGGESVVVDGLTEEDSYTVSEESAGYVATNTYQVGDGEIVNGTGETLTKTASTFQTEKVEFTNTKKGTVPTGILMTAAPYVAVVGLGGVFAGMFFRRKRED